MPDHAKPPVVLTIDDERLIRENIQDFLEDYGYEVLGAKNGREGLELFEAETPDLILVDLRMPEIDGLELLARVRKRSPDTPVIVVSGTGIIGDAVEALRLGAWDYLLKPIQDLSMLRHAVEKALERARLIRENRAYQEHLEEAVAQRTEELRQANLELREINARLRMSEEALQKANDELEKRVEERTTELQITNEELREAKDAADAAARAKSSFLANMSHEIRTPMNGVIAASDLALKEAMSPKVRHLVETIHSSGYTLMGIINDILDFSKIEAGKMDMEIRPLILNELLDDAIIPLMSKIAEKEIELLIDLAPETPMTLRGDPLRIQQILTNLLSNAVKFTEKAGIIIVGVREQRKLPVQHLTELRFFVKDTGTGMFPDLLDRLFEPFTQADTSTTRKYGGTGLGLSICKRLTEMMQGDIWAESIPGEGSTFYFTLLLEQQAVDQGGKFVVPQGLRGLRVLVTDDCAESRMLLQRLLESFDFRVKTAASGLEALRMLETDTAFDLFIMDWRMPGLNGIETADSIRGLKLNTPILVMSAFGKETELETQDRKNISGFLRKPFHATAPSDTIMDILGEDTPAGKAPADAAPSLLSNQEKRIFGKHVLVVEDNLTNQEIARIILENAGAVVQIASDGRESLEMVRDNVFDAVFMDIQMPEMDGYEATEIMRKSPEFAILPIIAMTAHAMKGDEEKCLSAGMDAYVTKPISQDRLLSTLCRVLDTPRVSLASAEKETPDAREKDAEDEKRRLPSEIQGIAIQETLKLLSIDEDAYVRILQCFLRNNNTLIPKFQDAFEQEDWMRLRDLAHSMKGSSASIGAKAVQKSAQALEEAASRDAAENMPAGKLPTREMIEHLEADLNQVLNSIALLADTSGKKRPSLQEKASESTDLGPALKIFADALNRANPREVRTHWEILKRHLDPSFAQEIEDNIHDYDYEDALESLKKIMTDLGIEMGEEGHDK